jgi:hypothetical protein
VNLQSPSPAEQIIDLNATTMQEWSISETTSEESNYSNPEQYECLERRTRVDNCPSALTSVSLNPSIATMIDTSLQSSNDLTVTSNASWDSPTPFWHFSETHFDILARFRNRTALTLGDKGTSPEYRDCVTHLALSVRRKLLLVTCKT